MLTSFQIYGSRWLVALGWTRTKAAKELGIHRMSVGKFSSGIKIGHYGFFQCIKCEMVLPIDLLPKYKGNGAKCKSCRHLYHKNDAKRVKKLVIDHYGAKCFCCGEDRLGFLTIDHINNDGSRDIRKRNASRGYRWVLKAGLPGDLRIACYNCNCGRHYNGGVCPHKEGGDANDSDC